MKHLIILLCLTCSLYSIVFGQVASPDSVAETGINIKEKLITLALQNPDLEIADHQINIAKYNLKAAKGWWTQNFSLSFNANEFSIKQIMGKKISSPATPYYNYGGLYPLYNMGISIPIGGIFSQPQVVKADREQVAIAEAERENKNRQVRAAVLTAYENYLTSKELYTVESQLAESAYNDYLQAKEKFRNGESSVTDYNAAIDRYQSSLKARIGSENNYNLAQIQLEALIGVPVGQVLTNMRDSGTPSQGKSATHTEKN